MSFLRKVLTGLRADERGVAMVVVMGVLLVTSTLAFAVAATAQRSSEGTVRDSNSKRALAAAESGLNVGRFRVGKAHLATPPIPDTACFGGPAGTPCEFSEWEPDGNGAEFRYKVSATAPGTACVIAATPPTPANSRERCVTAIGRFGGVERRLQMRVVENRGAPLFPFPGMIGLDRISLNHSAANGDVGSNGQIQVGPNSAVTPPNRIKLGPSASVVPNNYGTGRRDTSPTPFVLDFYTDWYSTSVKAPQAAAPYSRTPPNYGTNAIGELNGRPGFATTAQRQVSVTGQNVVLTGGRDYNFCSLVMNAGARFVVPVGTTQPVRIFIDSHTRPGSPDYVPSGCPALSGDVINLSNMAGFTNATGQSSMLQLFVYGGNNQNILFNSEATFTGTLWAPQSKVTFNAGATVKGAIAARDIEFRQNGGNAGFTGDLDANNVTGRWDGTYKRNGWRECSPRGNTPGC